MTAAEGTSVTGLTGLLAQLSGWEHDNHQRRIVYGLNLNAATNAVSQRCRAALSSTTADRGASGGLHSRHHPGSRDVDQIESAIAALTGEVFGATGVDLRPPTGSIANAIVLAACVPRDRPILVGRAESLAHYTVTDRGWGGRLTGGVQPLAFAADGVSLDLERIAEDVERHRPAAIILGSQAMLFPLDLAGLRRIAEPAGALIVYDAAHPLGMIAGGQFQVPLAEGSDVITASTQKSFPGPVGGLVLTNDETINTAVYRAADLLLANYHNNRVLALGIAMAEMAAFGPDYARACIANAQYFAGRLADSGFDMPFADRGYTQSNVLLVRWPSREAADSFARRCEEVNISLSTIRIPGGTTADRAAYPDEPAGPFGTRIGLQDLTRRGIGHDALEEIARILADVAAERDLTGCRAAVADLAATVPTVYYTFDHPSPP